MCVDTVVPGSMLTRGGRPWCGVDRHATGRDETVARGNKPVYRGCTLQQRKGL